MIIATGKLIQYRVVKKFIAIRTDGFEWGRVEKNKSEAYVFRRGHGAHVFETPFGKIGIGICADNHFTSFINSMQKSKINLIIMPHALPIPQNETDIISKEDIKRIKNDIEEFPILVSNLLGVPTIFINQTGPFLPMIGIMGKMLPPNTYQLGGYSKIVNKEGLVLSEIHEGEGMIIAEVDTRANSYKRNEVPNYDGWIQEGSSLLRRFILPIDIAIGKLYYFFKK